MHSATEILRRAARAEATPWGVACALCAGVLLARALPAFDDAHATNHPLPSHPVALVQSASEPTAVSAADAPPVVPAPGAQAARKPAARLSPDARQALEHVLALQDNGGKPFVVIDKRKARLWAFDPQGQLAGTTPVLLGLARGDDTVPGVGNKPLSAVRPWERTTPAGRFIAEHGRNAKGEDVLWVDYDAAVSMHRVHNVHAWERRLQRLKTPGLADNRISYGCINLPTAFYNQVLVPLVGSERPVVYLLPETRPVVTIFGPQAA